MHQQTEAKVVHLATPPLGIRAVGSAEEGRAILERVRIAIGNATYEPRVPIGRIRRMFNQPRKYFNPDQLLRLSDSIKKVGQTTPGCLRVISEDAEGHDRELIDGERRWNAIQMAGVPTFRAMIVDVDDEAAQYLVSLIANFNREGHTVLEIAEGIRVSREQLKLDMKEIAELIGYSEVYVASLYGLRRLVPEVRKMLDPETPRSRRLPTQAAIEISRVHELHQLQIAERVIRREINLRSLRGEVVKVSERHGLPIRKRVEDPHTQRQRIEVKTSAIRRNVAELKDRLEETRMPILIDWTSSNLLATRGELSVAQDDLKAAVNVLDEAVRRKTGRR